MINTEEKHKSYAVKMIDFRVTRRYGINDGDILTESRCLQHISHPNLVKYHHSYSDSGHTISLVMDLVIGNDIGYFATAKDRPTHYLQYKWFVEVMSALDHLKSLGHMAHGDIQPKNIIINSTTGDAKLVGICLPSLRRIITPALSPPVDSYMSAERLCGEPYDDRDDMWALGVVFAELLLGLRREVPIWGTDEKAVEFQEQLLEDCRQECGLMAHFIARMITPSALTRCSIADMKRCIELSPTDHPVRNCSARFPLMSQAPPSVAASRSSEGGAQSVSVVGTSHLGAGDLLLLEKFLHPELEVAAKSLLQKEVKWCQLHEISYDSSAPRMASFQARIDSDGSLPVYRCPDPQPWHRKHTTSSFTATVDLIRREAEKVAGHSFNWCRILHYKDGSDGLAFHSDKSLDMRPGSFVATVSLGDERSFALKGKHSGSGGKASASVSGSGVQRLKLKHNSLLLLGPNTNTHFLHAVEKASGRSKMSGRISLTFRDIATFYSPLSHSRLHHVCLYGQGAPLNVHSKDELQETNRLIRRRYTAATTSVSLLAGALGAGFRHLLIPLWPEVWASPRVGGLVSCGSVIVAGIITQIVHIYQAHVRRQVARRRLAAVFHLFDFLPMDHREALRLAACSSEAEIGHLLKTCKDSTGSVLKNSSAFGGSGRPARVGKRLTFSLPDQQRGDEAAGIVAPPRPVTPPRSAVAFTQKPPEGSGSAGGGSSLRSLTAPSISVCVIIDAVKDFLYGSGAFAKAFGLQDTLKIRHMKHVFSRIYHCCHERGIQVVLVKSKYSKRQFRSVPGLCSSESGCEFAFECEACRGSSCVESFTNDLIITKTSNSILDCDTDEAREELLRAVRNKAVLLCGVTTVACVSTALADLIPHCSSLHVAKDGVASRGSSEEREGKLFQQWGGDRDDDRGDPGFENVHVVDSWETCLLYRRGDV
jgi:serine/threonine protein kinase/nicotinamidase-related amidase